MKSLTRRCLPWAAAALAVAAWAAAASSAMVWGERYAAWQPAGNWHGEGVAHGAPFVFLTQERDFVDSELDLKLALFVLAENPWLRSREFKLGALVLDVAIWLVLLAGLVLASLRWTVVTLRSMFLLTGFAAVLLGWARLGSAAHQREEAALSELSPELVNRETGGPDWIASRVSLLHLWDRATRVVLQHRSLAPSDLARLQDLSGVELLNLRAVGLDDAGLQSLANLCRLRQLDLSANSIQGVGLSHLCGARLVWLDLSDNPLEDEACGAFAQFPALQTLAVSGSNITSHGISRLSSLPQLQHLEAARTPIGDAGFTSLAALPGLIHLDLRGSQVGDRGLAAVSEDNLVMESLDLRETPISADGLLHLGQGRTRHPLSEAISSGIRWRDKETRTRLQCFDAATP